ncbi:MAG: GNAT family N-acetyltransferase [Saprospiraceae bacterium]|nr:GNAT family N-acetyltransferase [Saprospiraceae bacterium]MCB9319232.1 GNAT family N-acetyltransferase [Lewinellaceae bacterium]
MIGPVSWQKAQNSDSTEIKALIRRVMAEFGFTSSGPVLDAMPDPDAFNALGFLGVLRFQEYIMGTYAFLPLSEDTVEIQKIYLVPELRGNHLGREMMKQLERIVSSRGFKKITMLSSGRYQAALRLYDQLGYVRLHRPEDTSAFCDWQLEKVLLDD